MPNAILEFKSVCYGRNSKHITHIENASFSICSGEVLVVSADADREYAPVVDLALGLVTPSSGMVCFNGINWLDMDAFEEAESRGRIGSVFEAPGWISSLNVIDNIVLRERHHTQHEEGEIRDEVSKLVAKAGIDDSYDINLRPALVQRRRLRVYEWVRACMGNTALIMLSFPERGAPSASLKYLLTLIKYMAEKGTAVMIITSSDVILDNADKESWDALDWSELFGKISQ